MINVFVPGDPVTQGSMRVMRGRAIHSNHTRLMRWRSDIADSHPWTVTDGMVDVELRFFIKRPRTTKRSYPRLDIDKLIRAVLDALTGHAYGDDSQVVTVTASKEFSDTPGVRITMRSR